MSEVGGKTRILTTLTSVQMHQELFWVEWIWTGVYFFPKYCIHNKIVFLGILASSGMMIGPKTTTHALKPFMERVLFLSQRPGLFVWVKNFDKIDNSLWSWSWLHLKFHFVVWQRRQQKFANQIFILFINKSNNKYVLLFRIFFWKTKEKLQYSTQFMLQVKMI